MSTLSKLEKKIGVSFKNKNLLENAFIHRSFLNEHKDFHMPSNEKLEFLGDSVLSLITSVYLYKNYTNFEEGDYTEIKAAIVKTSSLASAASELELGQYLMLSKGEEMGRGRTNPNILADTFEALIAAIFLDRGFDSAYHFVLAYLFEETLEKIIQAQGYRSSKSSLQEHFQGKYKKTPIYQILKEEGPEHARTFTVGVYMDDRKLGVGVGKSKKEAEEIAAHHALEKMRQS